MPVLSLRDARAILGDDVLGADEVSSVFQAPPPSVPLLFTPDQLHVAQRAGEMLVLRASHAGENTPLTMLSMIQRFPDSFDQKLLRQVGYQLKDEWGIELEPRAATDTCAPGWALVRKGILEESRNLTYDQQAAVLACAAADLGVPERTVRRRTAVEAVYDLVLYSAARRRRLLEQAWDWTASRTIDGGYLNVGGFTARGMQILSFSTGVRHGALGVCPTRNASE